MELGSHRSLAPLLNQSGTEMMELTPGMSAEKLDVGVRQCLRNCLRNAWALCHWDVCFYTMCAGCYADGILVFMHVCWLGKHSFECLGDRTSVVGRGKKIGAVHLNGNISTDAISMVV